MSLLLTHRSCVDELDAELSGFLSVWDSRPYAETILLTLLETDAEETVVLHCGMLVRVTRIIKSYIMRITLEWSVIHDLKTSTDCPALKAVVRELERAVLDQLCIESAVCGKVDVLDEDSVHCRLDLCARLVHADLHFICLSRNGYGSRDRKKR